MPVVVVEQLTDLLLALEGPVAVVLVVDIALLVLMVQLTQEEEAVAEHLAHQVLITVVQVVQEL
jgi:isoprenylcysteine carboxyl methyltransferase (ICMT) family protein YpbQ